MPYPVGKSSYPDLKGQTQYVASLEVARQVASLCYEFDTQVAKNGDRLTVNEGIRSRERQNYLYYTVYLKENGALAAYPYTSTHDSTRGSALDFGITDRNGNNRALSPAEFDWLHGRAPRRGIAWTGANFIRVEPWHHNGGYAASVAPIVGVNLPGEPIVKESQRPSAPDTEESEDTMKITYLQRNDKSVIGLLWGPTGKAWKIDKIKVAGQTIAGGTVRDLLVRWIRADQSKSRPETFNEIELQVLQIAFKKVQ